MVGRAWWAVPGGPCSLLNRALCQQRVPASSARPGASGLLDCAFRGAASSPRGSRRSASAAPRTCAASRPTGRPRAEAASVFVSRSRGQWSQQPLPSPLMPNLDSQHSSAAGGVYASLVDEHHVTVRQRRPCGALRQTVSPAIVWQWLTGACLRVHICSWRRTEAGAPFSSAEPLQGRLVDGGHWASGVLGSSL